MFNAGQQFTGGIEFVSTSSALLILPPYLIPSSFPSFLLPDLLSYIFPSSLLSFLSFLDMIWITFF